MLWIKLKILWKKVDAILDGAAYAVLVSWGVASIFILLGELTPLRLSPNVGGVLGFCAGVVMRVMSSDANASRHGEHTSTGHPGHHS